MKNIFGIFLDLIWDEGHYILILHPVTLDDRFVSCESRNFAAFETLFRWKGGYEPMSNLILLILIEQGIYLKKTKGYTVINLQEVLGILQDFYRHPILYCCLWLRIQKSFKH